MISTENNINLKSFTFNAFNENTYLLWDEESKDGVLFDPGCSDDQEEIELSGFILEKRIKLLALINTHCHIDHIWGNAFVKDTWACTFIVPENELPLLEAAQRQGNQFGVKIPKQPKPDSLLSEEGILEFGTIKLDAISTPGHAPGEFCFKVQGTSFLISGDVLFKESIGRTDLWGGDSDTLFKSISEKLLTLPDETKVFPGHGGSTTIGYERNHNPFLT